MLASIYRAIFAGVTGPMLIPVFITEMFILPKYVYLLLLLHNLVPRAFPFFVGDTYEEGQKPWERGSNEVALHIEGVMLFTKWL